MAINKQTSKGVLPYMLWACFMLLGTCSLHAQIQVSGKVIGRTGKPLPGIIVYVKNTLISSISGSDGGFAINSTQKINSNAIQLEIFASGYKSITKDVTNGDKNIVITLLKDGLSLDEVVVTGAGVATSKRKLGVAVTTLTTEDITQGAATSIDQAIQGKIAGAQINQNSGNPAGGMTIRLRGASTIVGSSDPLYIIDGVIVNNDSRQLLDLGGYTQNRIVDINPSDIEKIEIIKGAAASAIYGSRANNGVVQIFTKKGREGAPVFSFSSQLKMSSLRKKIEYNKAPIRFANNNITDLSTIAVERYDLQRDIFRQAAGYENNLNVSGGTDKTKYFASIGALNNEGIIDKTTFNRYNFRLNMQQRLTRTISLSLSSSFIYNKSNEIPNGGISESYGALTGFIFSNNFVNPAKDPLTGLYPSTISTPVQRTNPLEAINRFDFEQNTNRSINSLQLTIKPIEGLTIDYTLGIDNYTQSATALIPPNNTTPSYKNGYSRRADASVFQINNDVTISFLKVLKKFETSTAIGGTIQYDKELSFVANAVNLGLFGATVNNGTVAASEFRGDRSIMGAFAQQTFGFGSRFYLTGAARIDASSVFSKENRWQFYPKISGTYILSNEKFWQQKMADIVSLFKLRVAYGQSGNLTAIGINDRLTNYDPVLYNSQTGYVARTRLGNSAVKPERSEEFEFGVDISLFHSRINLEFTSYNKQVKDLILNRTLAPTTGYNNTFVNIGEMSNKGYEVLLRTAIIEKDRTKWNVSFSYSNNKNITNGIQGNGVLPFEGGFGQVAAVNGYPLGSFYSTFFARDNSGNILRTSSGFPQRELGVQLANGNYEVQRNGTVVGQPSGAVLNKIIGDPNPKHIFTFINDLSIKRWHLRMQWDGMQDFDVINFTKRTGDRDLYGGFKGYENELLGKVPKGTNAALASIFENWVEDGSFIKLRELSLSYNIQKKIWKFSNMRISLTGRNLLSFDNYSGWDSETNAAGQSNSVRGLDFAEVPLPRVYQFGIQLQF
jgi:TonB-dependent starch-binding outer membrane protein SusC